MGSHPFILKTINAMIARVLFVIIIIIGVIILIPIPKPEPPCLVCGDVSSKFLAISLVVLGAAGVFALRGLGNLKERH